MTSEEDRFWLVGTTDVLHIASGRAFPVINLARWLTPDPQLAGTAANIALDVERLASRMLGRIEHDNPELTMGLCKLLEAKDALVRAYMKSEAQRG